MHENGLSQFIRPQRHMNCLGPATLGLKYHLLRHDMNVSDSLLSTSILKVRVYSTVGDTLSHSFTVLDKCIV